MADPVVVVDSLAKSYGTVQALRGISFEIPSGSVVGFLGPNGAGKTTAMKVLTGYLAADQGRVEVCGVEVEKQPMLTKQQVGYLPENNPLYPESRVRDFLAFAGKARGLRGSGLRQAVDRVVVETGLEEVYWRPIGECSKGFRQRVGLAQAMLHDPPLLILDEPTNGLDPNQTQEMRQLVRRLGKTKTVLLTTHILPEVEALAERVVLIHQGEKVADGALSEISGAQENQFYVRIGIRGNRSQLVELLDDLALEVQDDLPRPFGNDAYYAARAVGHGGPEILEALSRQAARKSLPLVELQAVQTNLEDVFRHLTLQEEPA